MRTDPTNITLDWNSSAMLRLWLHLIYKLKSKTIVDPKVLSLFNYPHVDLLQLLDFVLCNIEDIV